MITTVFGKPRAGKTTYAASLVVKNNKKLAALKRFPFLKRFIHPYTCVYCNDSTISGAIHYDIKTLGKWLPAPNSLIIIEEAGIYLSNKKWKDLSDDSRWLAAMHGHVPCDIIIISQSVDIDISYRQRSESMYLAEKSFLRNFTLFRSITYSVDVDENTHELVDGYFKTKGIALLFSLISPAPGSSFMLYRPPYYKHFDTHTLGDKQFTMAAPILPIESEKEEKEEKDTKKA